MLTPASTRRRLPVSLGVLGVLIVMVIQIGLISPPVGMNLFVLNTLLPGVRLGTIFRGVWPFVVVQVLMLIVLVAFPVLSLWLPSFMQ